MKVLSNRFKLDENASKMLSTVPGAASLLNFDMLLLLLKCRD